MTIPNPTTVAAVGADLLTAVVEQTPTPLWVIGADGSVQLVNRAAVTLLGYRDADELIGRPSHCTLHERRPDGSEYPAEACPIVGPLDAPARAGTEWFTTRSGHPVPVLWTTRSLHTGGSTLLAFEEAGDRIDAERRRSRWNRRMLTEDADGYGDHHRDGVRDDLLRRVHEHFRDPQFSVSTLAKLTHVSVRSVQMLFAEVGRTPAEEIRRARLEFAARLLARGATVRSACYDSGFSDPGTFARAFRRHFGHCPSDVTRARPRLAERPDLG